MHSQKPTGIKPPSKLPALSTIGRGLSELSAADNNSRAMPSSVVPTKHKVSGRMLLLQWTMSFQVLT